MCVKMPYLTRKKFQTFSGRYQNHLKSGFWFVSLQSSIQRDAKFEDK